MDLGLTDRVYVVTGGSRGLGQATADALVADGARVVLAGRTKETLDAAVRELGERATGVVADLSDPSAPELLVDAARSTYGGFDGALISVGGPPAGSIMDTPDEAWSSAFDSVFLGAVRMSRVFSGALREGGSLALVLSTSVKAPLDDLAISNGLRPGLGMLVKMLSEEVGPRGIRVNALMPGRIETERVRELDDRSDDPGAARRAHEERIPLRRYGDPEEFGRVAAFLLSPASSFVSGALVPVDGGMLKAL